MRRTSINDTNWKETLAAFRHKMAADTVVYRADIYELGRSSHKVDRKQLVILLVGSTLLLLLSLTGRMRACL